MTRRAEKAIPPAWREHPNPNLRLLGVDPPVGQLLVRAEKLYPGLIRVGRQAVGDADDALIDPGLPLLPEEESQAGPEPEPRVGYAGLNAAQRTLFHRWVAEPARPGPTAFRRLYLAGLEANLFAKAAKRRRQTHQEIRRLVAEAEWGEDADLARTGVLAAWLAQDQDGLGMAMARAPVASDLWHVLPGWLAPLGGSLTSEVTAGLLQAWRLRRNGTAASNALPDREILQLRLDSLRAALNGKDPLQAAWEEVAAQAQGEEQAPFPAAVWRPWRTVHRNLRILLPQVDLRPQLEPLLAELLMANGASPPAEQSAQPEMGPAAENGAWQLVLEFGDSRSTFYDYVVAQAQKRPTYRLLMDENRRMVHRISFSKRDMRHFWRLWEYVQKWSSTHVYVNGQELEGWKIWPYSPYLRP